MKLFFKTVFIFLFCIFFQGILNSSNLVETYTAQNYIQNERPNVELYSEPMGSSEIFSEEESSSQDCSNGRFYFVTLTPKDSEMSSNRLSQLANDNIHKLSTNSRKANYIRAP